MPPLGSSANSGLSPASPIRITDFWSRAAPGDTLWLLDGTYTGADNMISPPTQGAPANFSGTSTNRISIRALNDGKVLIDGQFVSGRNPVNLLRNSWFTLEGFNARNGGLRIVETTGVTVRRVISWDGRFTGKSDVALFWKTTGSLVEDSAFFGTGFNVLEFTNSTGPNTVRRVWARWEGSSAGDSKRTIMLSYNVDQNTARCENCLATWTAESMPQHYYYSSGGKGKNEGDFESVPWRVNSPQPLISYGTPAPNVLHPTNGAYVVGSLAYMMPATSSQPSGRGNDHPPGMYRIMEHAGWTWRHVMAFVSPTHARFNSIRGFDFNNYSASFQTGALDHATSVRGSLGDRIGTGPTVTNPSLPGVGMTSLSAARNPWTNAGDGANLCKRWVNGQLTNEPLWPWPMEDRIKAATALAGNTFQNGNPCNTSAGNCTGLPSGPRPEVSVTGQMEQLFGVIPVECREVGGPIPPPFPESENFPDVDTIRDSGVGDGPIAPEWESITGQPLLYASSTIVPPSTSTVHNMLWKGQAFSGSQVVFVEIVTPQGDGAGANILTFLAEDANNRFAVSLSRVAGVNNDVLRLHRIVDGAAQTLIGTAELNFEISAGDWVGARSHLVDGLRTLELHYRRAGDVWRLVASTVVASVPSTSFLGLGLRGGAVRNFGGGHSGTDSVLLTPGALVVGLKLLPPVIGDPSGELRARPFEDVSVGGWTAAPPSPETLHDKLSENSPNDEETYIQSALSPDGDTCEVKLRRLRNVPGALPRVRVRYRRRGSDPVDLTVKLFAGETEIAGWLYEDIAGEWFTAMEELTTEQRDAFSTASGHSDPRLRFTATVATP